MKKFEVGDKILVIGPPRYAEPEEWLSEMDPYVGLEGKISSSYNYKDLDPNHHWYYLSFGEDHDMDNYVWNDEWLTHVEDKTQNLHVEDKTQNLHVPGAKDNVGKPPVGLLFESFPRALLEVASVAGYGAEKYTRGGWKYVPNAIQEYANAAGRHELYRFIDGEKDLESNKMHLAHQAWNILAILEKILEN